MPEVARRLQNQVKRLIWTQRYRDRWCFFQRRRVLARAAQRDGSFDRTVRLIANFPGLWQRTIEQTPGGSCQWGRTLFVAEGDADLYLVLNSNEHANHPRHVPQVELPNRERVWGLHMEPEEYIRELQYDTAAEHGKISRFYTNSERLLAQGGIYQPAPPYVHFLLGKSWDFLDQAKPPPKPVTLGVVCSSLIDLPGHRARLQFLEALEASGISFHLWGRGDQIMKFRGYRGFALTKWSVHAGCRYSLIMENTVSDLYWSEKLADSLLAWSLPLYYGCPRISAFLPADSVVPIDVAAPDSVKRVAEVLVSGAWEARLPAVREARRLLLQRENLYAFIDREMEAHFHERS